MAVWAGKVPPTGKCFSLHLQTCEPQNHSVAAAVSLITGKAADLERPLPLCKSFV